MNNDLFPLEEKNNGGEITLYQTPDKGILIDVQLQDGTVWLNAQQMADLYNVTRRNINLHIQNIISDNELNEDLVSKQVLQTRLEGKRLIKRSIALFNLDMIIAVGYRVKSSIATQFRQWATARLSEYIKKGFTIDDARLKEAGGGGYWKELLDRIRDIRSSEKVMFRQILDLYATSIDYNPHADTTREFFSVVQNKFHYAAHGNTAAEVIYYRSDAQKPFMGMLNFSGSSPLLKDAKIAKNYLNEQELKTLNNLVSGYFDIAEMAAIRKRPMRMIDYLKQLDMLLTAAGEAILEGKGRISHEMAMKKVEQEYKQYQQNTLSAVEQEYLSNLNNLQKKLTTNQKRKQH